MTKISDLSDELLVKILSFLPTKVAVSTSILSKQWEFLWMWCPDLEFDCNKRSVRDFINKNLPLHRVPIINSFCLTNLPRAPEAENFKSWVEIAVSHGIRELICRSYFDDSEVFLVLPSSFYTCNSLVTLELESPMILVDVPQIACLPSLKTLQLRSVTYSNEDSFRLLLYCCPILEDLTIKRQWKDNMRKMVIIMSSLRRLSLVIDGDDEDCCYYDNVIVTPSLKYFKLHDYSEGNSYLIDMPELDEADITLLVDNESLFASITSVKRLSLSVTFYDKEASYRGGIDFSQLENLKLYICYHNWSQLLFLLLKDSPNLQTLYLLVAYYGDLYDGEGDSLVSCNRHPSLVPECLLKSLQALEFKGYGERQEERDCLSYIIKHARCLKSTSILRTT